MKLTPLKAIKKNCIECSGGTVHEVKKCVIKDCPLFEYRLGTNAARKGIGNHKADYKTFINKNAS